MKRRTIPVQKSGRSPYAKKGKRPYHYGTLGKDEWAHINRELAAARGERYNLEVIHAAA